MIKVLLFKLKQILNNWTKEYGDYKLQNTKKPTEWTKETEEAVQKMLNETVFKSRLVLPPLFGKMSFETPRETKKKEREESEVPREASK